jgi:hypothetical protein
MATAHIAVAMDGLAANAACPQMQNRLNHSIINMQPPNQGTTMTTHTTDSITNLLMNNDKAVERAMIVIWNNRNFSLSHYDALQMIRQFSCYVQGIDAKTNKKRWAPKSLTHKHCAPAFVKSKLISKGDEPIKMARDLAIDNVDLLTKFANNEKLLYPSFSITTLERGAYKDTVKLHAFRNDNVPADSREWPYYSENLGKATEEEYDMYPRINKLGITKEEFIANYTLVKKTRCFLD